MRRSVIGFIFWFGLVVVRLTIYWQDARYGVALRVADLGNFWLAGHAAVLHSGQGTDVPDTDKRQEHDKYKSS